MESRILWWSCGRRQQAADDYERRREARKVAEELESRRVLEWAIANPATPEGRRHLEEDAGRGQHASHDCG